MAYRLIITDRSEELLEDIARYLLFQLKNEQAASHLFNSIDKIYNRLEENPYQFPESRDIHLKRFGYREAVLTDMDYVIVFRVEDDRVYVVGIFHQLENYRKKIK